MEPGLIALQQLVIAEVEFLRQWAKDMARMMQRSANQALAEVTEQGRIQARLAEALQNRPAA